MRCQLASSILFWRHCWKGGCTRADYDDAVLAPGLVAVMLLLGFGLVRIPRSMLQEADPAARLAYAHHK